MTTSSWKHEYSTFQDQLKQLRLAVSLTQAELAEKLDKPQSYVSKYESGERKLDFIEVREVVLACGSTLQQFVTKYEKSLGMVSDK